MSVLALGILAPYLLTCFAVELTPGPNMGYLVILSIERGRTAGLFAVLGVALGLATLGVLAGVGAGELIAQNRWLYEALRWAGVAYLCWLAWDSWRESRLDIADPSATEGLSIYFRRGLLTNLLNPKAVLFYLTVMPRFTVEELPLLPQAIGLATVYVAVATLVHAGIVLGASTLGPLLFAPHLRRRLGLLFALLLLVIAVWVAFSTRR
jgi:threonine/homoserine/homoserine lactone efflux protein